MTGIPRASRKECLPRQEVRNRPLRPAPRSPLPSENAPRGIHGMSLGSFLHVFTAPRGLSAGTIPRSSLPSDRSTRRHSLMACIGYATKQSVSTMRMPSNERSGKGRASARPSHTLMPRPAAMLSIRGDTSIPSVAPRLAAKRPVPTPTSNHRPWNRPLSERRHFSSVLKIIRPSSVSYHWSYGLAMGSNARVRRISLL